MTPAVNSCRPEVTTLAKWLFLFRSATRMASSSLPSRRAPATAGANWRDCFRAALKASQRSIITPIDHADMINRTMATVRAGQPMCPHMPHRSKRTGSSLAWKIQTAAIYVLATIRFARLTANILCNSSSGTLGVTPDIFCSAKHLSAHTFWTPRLHGLLPNDRAISNWQ